MDYREISGLDRSQRPGQAREAKTGEGAEKRRVGEQARQYGAHFCIGIGSDGIECAHHALLL